MNQYDTLLVRTLKLLGMMALTVSIDTVVIGIVVLILLNGVTLLTGGDTFHYIEPFAFGLVFALLFKVVIFVQAAFEEYTRTKWGHAADLPPERKREEKEKPHS